MNRGEKYRQEAERARQAYNDALDAGDALLAGKESVDAETQARADEHFAAAKAAHASVYSWLDRAKEADAMDELGEFRTAVAERNRLPLNERATGNGVARTSELNDMPTVVELTERRRALRVAPQSETALRRWPVESCFAYRIRESVTKQRVLPSEHRAAWTEYSVMLAGINAGELHEFNITPTQGTGTDAAGGVLVPDYLMREIALAAKFEGPLADDALIRVWNSPNSGEVKLPVNTDIKSQEPAFAAESTDVTPKSTAFSSVTFNPRNFAVHFAVPETMLMGDMVSIEAFLTREIAVNFGSKQNDYFTKGSGTNQPKGVTVLEAARRQNKSGARTAALTEADVINTLKKLDAAYHRRPTSRAMAHQNTIFDLMTLRSSGQLVFPRTADGLNLVLPGGSPLLPNNRMQENSTATGAGQPVLYVGDLSEYQKVQVGGLRFNSQFELESYQWRLGWNTYLDGKARLEEASALLVTT